MSTLFQPFPYFPGDDLTYGGLSNSEHFGQFRVIKHANSIKKSNLKNLFPGQYIGCTVFTSGLFGAILFYAIMVIISCGASKQMPGIAARWIIAFVTHKMTRWNVSFGQLISKSVSYASLLVAYCQYAISSGANFSKKWPAFILGSLVYLFPKSFSDWREMYFAPSCECAPRFNGNLIKGSVWVCE